MTRSSFNRMIVESAASIWGRPIPRRRLFAHWHRLRGGISLSLSLYLALSLSANELWK